MSAPPPRRPQLTPVSPGLRPQSDGPRSPLNRWRRASGTSRRASEETRQERLSWARFEGVPSPSLAGTGLRDPRDPYSLGPEATPPRLGSSRRTRRSLEEELAGGSSVRFSPPAPAAYVVAAVQQQPPEAALTGADDFDRALFGLATEIDPWQSGEQVHLALVDYSEFRFVAESFRRWILCAALPLAQLPAPRSSSCAPQPHRHPLRRCGN